MSFETSVVLRCDGCGDSIDEGVYADPYMVERLIRGGGRALRRRQQRRPERECDLVDVDLGENRTGICTRLNKASVHLCCSCAEHGATIDGQAIPPAASAVGQDGER